MISTKLWCQWQPLMDWLTTYFPRDVLMPSPVGSKRPLHSHSKHPGWAWDEVDLFIKSNSGKKPYDVGILLTDLCVIDVDTHPLCDELEASFPVLRQAPCEVTAKGRHYFFKRSTLADKSGYFDGRAQVRHGVDFKTICKNGTSGFIVVAPSQGKSWLRPPWRMQTDIPEIPDDLLNAIARPHHHMVCATFSFPDGSHSQVSNNPWLARFECLVSLFDGTFESENVVIPLGLGTAKGFEELLWLCETKTLRRWPTDLAELRQLADYLGIPSQVHALLCPWSPYSLTARLGALDKINPTWAKLSVEDRGAECLVDLDSVGDLKFVPILTQRGQEWLFRECSAPTPPIGGSLLRPKPLTYAKRWLPAPVLNMLQRHKNLLLAGGAALSVASDCIGKATDFDLFLCGATVEQAEAVRSEFIGQPGVSVSTQTGTAVSVVWGKDDTVIQLITWLYESPEQVLDSFDLDPCKVAVGCFGRDELRIRVRQSWIEAMRHLTCWVDLGRWSVARILKYYAKGFDIVVPGLDRNAFKIRNPENFPVQRGISNLFKVEALVERRRRPWFQKGLGLHQRPSRPSYGELHSVLRNYCGCMYKLSAYEEMVPSTVFGLVLKAIALAGTIWIGLGMPRRTCRKAPRPAPVWRKAPVHGVLFPSSPCCASAFDFAKLQKNAEA